MELKPCPFCGNYAEILREGTTRQSMIVACAWCGCRLESNETGEPKQWNTRATDAELERLRADLARVTAERDDYRSRWEQTGCTRHHAMETAIKLNESCREQLESVIQERDRLRADLIAIQAAAEGISRTVNDSVGERLWAVKQIARAALNGEGEG